MSTLLPGQSGLAVLAVLAVRMRRRTQQQHLSLHSMTFTVYPLCPRRYSVSTAVLKTDKNPCPWGAYFLVGKE